MAGRRTTSWPHRLPGAASWRIRRRPSWSVPRPRRGRRPPGARAARIHRALGSTANNRARSASAFLLVPGLTRAKVGCNQWVDRELANNILGGEMRKRTVVLAALLASIGVAA